MLSIFEVEQPMIGSDDFFEMSAIGANDKNIIPDFPVVVVAFDGLL